MAFKRGQYVAYLGRAFRVRGFTSLGVEGSGLEALEIAHTGGAKGVVFVPVHRVAEAVRRISKAEAEHMDANIPQIVTRTQSRMQKVRAAKAAKASDWARLGGLAKAANKRAG